jgi:hypothetical protein
MAARGNQVRQNPDPGELCRPEEMVRTRRQVCPIAHPDVRRGRIVSPSGNPSAWMEANREANRDIQELKPIKSAKA